MSLISNEFIHELPLLFDVTKLKEIVTQAYGTSGNHQHRVADYPYMQQIQEQLPILGSIWNIYKFPPFKGLGVHVDAKRVSCINIPLSGSESSVTSFFEKQDEMLTAFDPIRLLYNIQTPLKEVFKFSLRQPTLMKNTIPHAVNAGHVERVIISWGLQEGIDFVEAKKIITNVC